jgi:hypothetical protein
MVAILLNMGTGGHFVDNGEWWPFCCQWGMVAILLTMGMVVILLTMGNGGHFVDNGKWWPFC